MVPKNTKRDLLSVLLNKDIEPILLSMSVSEFEDLAAEIKEKYPDKLPPVVILNGITTYAEFIDLSPHRISINSNKGRNSLLRIFKRNQFVCQKDFKKAEGKYRFFGDLNPQSSLQIFIREELLRVMVIFAITLLGLGNLTSYQPANSSSTTFQWSIDNLQPLVTANDVLIQVGAVFFSFFTLFTATQNFSTLASKQYFKRGLVHKYLQVDKLISQMAVIALILAGITRVLNTPYVAEILSFEWLGLHLNLLHIFTAISASFFINSLIAVADYYLKRSQNLYLNEMSKEVFDGYDSD